jgi:hypothetical protein
MAGCGASVGLLSEDASQSEVGGVAGLAKPWSRVTTAGALVVVAGIGVLIFLYGIRLPIVFLARYF